MHGPNNVSGETFHQPVGPDRAAAMGDMGIIAAQHAEATASMSNGMISAREVQRMEPGKQAELHQALQAYAAADAHQAKLDAYRDSYSGGDRSRPTH